MRGEENRVNARNQENLVRDKQRHTETHSRPLTACHPQTDSDLFLTVHQLKRTGSCLCPEAGTHTHLIVSRTSTETHTQTHKEAPRTQVETTCWRVWNVEADSLLHSQTLRGVV